MGLKAGFACVVVLLAAFCSANDDVRYQIDKDRLRSVAKDVGLGSLIDVSVPPGSEPDSSAATPVDVEAGDFEIKCSTSCEFVKKGYAQFSNPGMGRGAISIADQLTGLQQKLTGLEARISANPADRSLEREKAKLEGDIRSKTLVLQSAVKGNMPDTAGVPAEEAADLVASQRKLRDIEREMKTNPDNAALSAARDKLRAEVDSKNAALRAAASAEAEKTKLDGQVAALGKQLADLKTRSEKMPNDAALKSEMDRVKAQLNEKSAASHSLNPKEECYRVCVHPTIRKNAVSGGDAAHVNNCIRMCVKVMRMLVYKMGTKFL